ncbi:hypothetical protein MBBAR_17c00210 [Methanobrevibacter arboriphilus JCM 13429 = DSM 1125]|uniref:Uncharacterized protein n=1 Tax=Methanobrevibacter arboriphilus JCM 13429 = DSM 1125 TaxID=1300164 RepID=A0A1V6N119_METAZ|nr:hypothetical protein [Methanobrevibacter arboriphilus]OQD58381.1 hypothetical protein MBBAR_17c00210 [Methanobrevibacter arboriphilus JCM 13429 = DSM 1125]
MVAKVKTTLNLNKDIMKSIKLIALNKETTQTKVINDLLEKAIENEDNIFKKNPKIKPMKKSKFKKDSNKSLEDLIGSIKTKKEIDAVELINEVRKGE